MVQYLPDKLQADVLIAPHHGSKTSSTVDFIDAVAPRYVLFPVGYKNRFGFPKQAVLERYKRRGILHFDTANDGAITVNIAKDGVIKAHRFRESHVKFWSWTP